MTQTLPAKLDLRATQGQNWGPLKWSDAQDRLTSGYPLRGEKKCPPGLAASINRTFRKYVINGPLRQAHFVAQMVTETGMLTGDTEKGDDRYFRTMYEVLTPEEAGYDFDHKHDWLERLGFLRGRDRVTYVRDRPAEVRKKAVGLHNIQTGDGPRFRGRGLLQVTGRISYEAYGGYRHHDYATDPFPLLLATSADTAADVSGWFWAMKTYRGEHINACADRGSNADAQKLVTKAVNGALIAWPDRHGFFEYVWNLFNDDPRAVDTATLRSQKDSNSD